MNPPTHTTALLRAALRNAGLLIALGCGLAVPSAYAQASDSLARDSTVVDTTRHGTTGEELRRIPVDSLRVGSGPDGERILLRGPLDRALVRAGFENVTVAAGERALAYENRRWRNSAEARGHALAIRCGSGEIHARGAGPSLDTMVMGLCPPVA